MKRSRLLGALPVVAGLGACSSARLGSEDRPSIVLPARFLEGEQDGGVEPTEAEARPSASAAPDPGPPHSLPDPQPLAMPEQWEYVLRYRRKAITIESVRLLRFEQPVVTARDIGRWAFELWIGAELIDRVRFDFPLLGADEPPGRRKPLHDPPTFTDGADVARRILVPASPRATRAVLVDRATGGITELPWPPR